MISNLKTPAKLIKSLTATLVLAGIHFSAHAAEHPIISGYRQTNLVSDISGNAKNTDALLQNPWGIAFNPNGFVWVANNGTGTSTLYNGLGVPSAKLPYVNVPGADGKPGNPTGIVFNSGNDFEVTPNDSKPNPASFIFINESGSLAAWAPSVDISNAIVVHVKDSPKNPIYKGLALAGNGKSHYLYATDFHNARVRVFDTAFTSINEIKTFGCNFNDPTIPLGFAPFDIQNLNGALYVTYAKQDAGKEDDVHGPGLGYVNIFDSNGCLIRRFASRGS